MTALRHTVCTVHLQSGDGEKSAIARPMPLLAPVTSTDFPARFRFMLGLSVTVRVNVKLSLFRKSMEGRAQIRSGRMYIFGPSIPRFTAAVAEYLPPTTRQRLWAHHRSETLRLLSRSCDIHRPPSCAASYPRTSINYQHTRRHLSDVVFNFFHALKAVSSWLRLVLEVTSPA
jgi:hypothetical protein